MSGHLKRVVTFKLQLFATNVLRSVCSDTRRAFEVLYLTAATQESRARTLTALVSLDRVNVVCESTDTARCTVYGVIVSPRHLSDAQSITYESVFEQWYRRKS